MATIKKKTALDKGNLMFQQAQARNQAFTNVKGNNPATIQDNKLTLTNQTGLLEGRQSSDKVVGSTRTKPDAISADQMTPTSYEQIGAIQQENDYQGTKDVADALGLAENAPSDLEAYIKAQVNAKKSQDRSQQLALEGQKMDLRSQASTVSSQSDYGQAMAASGLNGPQSNLALSGGYQEAAKAQMDRLKIDDQQIALYDSQLKQAQLDGDLELAQSIQANKDAYVNQAMANEAAYVSALGDYEKTKAAVTQSNLASFQSLVDEGQELSVEAISGFAGQLGIPFEDAYGYYAGLQSIRDDKSLSLEEKDVAIQQAKQDLNDQITGMDTQAAKNTKAYISLVQSGADADTIAAFKSAAGITDYNDPFTQADLKLKQAQAKIAEAESNGQLINPLDQPALIKAQYENWALSGYEPGVIPQGGEYGVTANGDGSVSINTEVGFKAGQCGRFVNDVFGQKMMGDSYESKMSWVDPSIKVPEAGMAFVMETESPYGHTGIVESVNAETGMMTVVDSNWGNDEKIQRREIPISSVSGFVRPPKSISAGAELTLMDVPEDVRTAVTTKANQFDGEQMVKNFQVIQEGNNYMTSIDPKNLTSSDNQSIIYAFAKVMDPNSVVRESEYETVQRYAQSLASTYGFNAQRILANEEFLTEEAVNNMVATVQDRYNTSAKSYENLRSEYARTINNLAGGVNIADSILQNYATPETPEAIDEDTIMQEAEAQAEFDSLAGTDDEEDIYSIFN